MGLKCCYKATVDGFSATDFHRRCDFKAPASSSPTPAVASGLAGSARRGTTAPSTDDYYDKLDAFLFYWPDQLAAPAEAATEASPPPPVVLPKVGESGATLFDYLNLKRFEFNLFI
ncbi:hypothetical protein BDA96_04G081100 [Sorghum bicolor]|uniref:Uncharacterized protein n=1 Tax=Sorghum bicolor TaxID=4558 RepID=A0A921UJI9_SORBI|nr:hypothetical protein BDA96_04G081100 [Sorghum bicolor]